jgi:RNA polymerase sigma-70 factor (ECF subfamily)
MSSTLASRFSSAYRGSRAEAGADEALEAALHGFARRGRAAWPDVDLDAGVLAAYLGARAPVDDGGSAPKPPAPSPPTDSELVAWLEGLPAGDLFLACACAEGLPSAFRAFDAAFLDKIEVYLRALRPTPVLVAETKQELLEKLFVGVSGRPPKILQYGGQGALGGWVRVSAVRTALNLLEAEKAGSPRRDEATEVARAIVPDSDPELELVRASCAHDFTAAFREAMASLSRRSRSMLRFTFVERVSPARIAAIYGVHRTTAMRWIDAAQEEVLGRTRVRMMERLSLSPSECDRIFALVKSRLDISLTSLLDATS